MKLMFDSNNISVEQELNEDSGKQYVIKGIYSSPGKKNKNGRIYPMKIWESEVAKYQEIIQEGHPNSLMELSHPARTEVDMMEAVAKMRKLYIENGYVMGEAVLLDNPKANQLKTLIDNGIKMAVSSRGVGSIREGVVDNYKLITFDIIPNLGQSDHNAVMNGMVESYRLNEGILEDLSFTIDSRGHIVPMSESDCADGCDMYKKEDIQEAAMQKFKEILEGMKNSNPKINSMKNEISKSLINELNVYDSYTSNTEIKKLISKLKSLLIDDE